MSTLLELETLESFIDSLDKGIRGLFVFKFFSQDSIELGIFYCRCTLVLETSVQALNAIRTQLVQKLLDVRC